jgi:predicted transcriptional regulator
MFTQRFFGFNRNLSDEDHILLNNITNTHQSVVDQIVKKNTPPPTLFEFLNQESPVHESLIKFYKYIPQFKELNIDDQVYLIKYNLIKIVHLHGILIEKFQENPLMGVYMSKWIGEEFHHQMSRTRRYFDRFVEHPLVLQLALIVLIFSINLSTICDTAQSEFCVNDKEICKIQNFYTTLLWRYLNTIYEEKDAIRSMAIITTQILRYQTLMNEMEEIIRRETHPVNQLESSLFRLP